MTLFDRHRGFARRTLSAGVLGGLLALSFTLAERPARAQDAQAQAMGRALFNEGVSLFNQGNYAEACPKLEASLKHLPGIGTRGKLAECYEKLGRWASAWQLWRDVAQLATRAGEPTREQVANERAKALEPKLSYVTVTVAPANDLPGLVIKRNGQEVDRAKIGGAEPVDPGTIAFEVSAPGHKTATGQVVVKEGQTGKFDVPALESTSGPPPPPPPGGGDGTTGPGPTEPPGSDHESGSFQRPLGYVVAGAGLVALGVGAFFGLQAKSTYDKPFDAGDCDKASKQCDASGQDQVDSAHSKATLATILVAAGGAVAVGGVVLILTAPSGRSGLVIAPTTYASGGGLTALGRF